MKIKSATSRPSRISVTGLGRPQVSIYITYRCFTSNHVFLLYIEVNEKKRQQAAGELLDHGLDHTDKARRACTIASLRCERP